LTRPKLFVNLFSVLRHTGAQVILNKRPAKTLFLAHALTLAALGLIVALAF
jgi:hypothetical protein